MIKLKEINNEIHEYLLTVVGQHNSELNRNIIKEQLINIYKKHEIIDFNITDITTSEDVDKNSIYFRYNDSNFNYIISLVPKHITFEDFLTEN